MPKTQGKRVFAISGAPGLAGHPVCTCTMSWVLSELPRLRSWHSHEKTIEIVGRLAEDGDWNVHVTVLSNVQFGVLK